MNLVRGILYGETDRIRLNRFIEDTLDSCFCLVERVGKRGAQQMTYQL
jgi:hypothetical protein